MNPLVFSKCATRLLMALAAISGIFLTAGCGSSGSIRSLGGGFSTASLSGQYVIVQTGIGAEQSTVGTGVASFSETIVFTADGKGNINETCDDFDQVGGPFGGCSPVAGTYSIASDGTGSINIGGSNGFNYAITMIDDQHFYIIEQDFFATASGFGEIQDTTAFTAAPSGTFVFKAHNIDTSSRVGGITIAAGAISGTEDRLNLGSQSSSNVIATSVAMTAPDSNGRGKFTVSDGISTDSFNYYIVNSSKFHFMSNSSSGSLEIGQAEAQVAPAGGFSAATLPPAASYVFGSSGDTNNPLGIHSAGVFTTDGAGNIEAGSSTVPGAVDYVQDSTVNSNLAVSGGTYTLASSGRGTVNLTLTGGTISPQILLDGEWNQRLLPRRQHSRSRGRHLLPTNRRTLHGAHQPGCVFHGRLRCRLQGSCGSLQTNRYHVSMEPGSQLFRHQPGRQSVGNRNQWHLSGEFERTRHRDCQ